MTRSPEATRRSLLAMGAIGGAAIASGVSASPPSFDLTDPATRLKAYMMMRGALDDRLVIGFASGRYYGVIDNEVKPLYGFMGVTFARYRPAPGGGYEGASYEVPFFTDIETGEAMDHWLNPYTGETVEVSQAAYPPAKIAVGTDLGLTVPHQMVGMAMTDRVLPAMVSGEDVWMTEETFTAFQAPGMPRPIRFSELTTLHARLPDLMAPGAKRVPTQTAFTAVVSWRPWLKMGDRPGHLIGNGSGRYGVAFEELSPAWKRAATARRPDVMKDPNAALAKLMTAPS